MSVRERILALRLLEKQEKKPEYFEELGVKVGLKEKEKRSMEVETRKSEILEAMPSFTDECYSKAALLQEMFRLQSEMVRITFNDEHAENAKLTIWDVFNHVVSLNNERGHVADELLKEFKMECNAVSQYIRGEICGNKGESNAWWQLKAMHTYYKALRNVELSSENHRTELDIVVFTKKAVFVIEVKNTKQKILIDERGNYGRIKDDMVLSDKNIGEKMNDKTILLRDVIEKAGFENPNIISLVVFTNSCATVTNRYPYIQHCFLSELPHIIDGYEGDSLYTTAELEAMINAVKNANYVGVYKPEMEVDQMKHHFAEILATLENATEHNHEVARTQARNTSIVMDTAPSLLKKHPILRVLIPIGGAALMAVSIKKLSSK